MNELREAAQAALKEMEHANAVLLRQAGVGIIDMNAITNLRAALSAPDDAGPGMWMNRYGATMKTRDRVTANAMGFTIPLYTHQPRSGWRPASERPTGAHDVEINVIVTGHYDDVAECWRGEVGDVIDQSRVMGWRDVQPPTEESA